MTTPGYEQRPDLEVTHGHGIADAAATAGLGLDLLELRRIEKSPGSGEDASLG